MNYRFPSCKAQSLEHIIQNASTDAISLIKSMLSYNPDRRPTAVQCLQHPFFQVKLPIPISSSEATDVEASQLLEELGQSMYFEKDPFRQSKRETNDMLRQ